jgi:carbamoyltransferase
MSQILGVSAGFHDAAVSVVDSNNGKILFAGHSERYSKQKNDANLCSGIISEIEKFDIDTVSYYETPWRKQLRQIYSGQGPDWNSLTVKQILKRQGLNIPQHTHVHAQNHHMSHAAAGFQTSPYNEATVVVIDAIGEWDSITIWAADYDSAGHARYRKLWSQQYPHSIGLMYSAVTARVGLRPMDEEYILMGMAAYGSKHLSDELSRALVRNQANVTFQHNLHTGLPDHVMCDADHYDLAAAAQSVAEALIYDVMRRAQSHKWSRNLVYMGGVALNCLANRRLGGFFDNIWIMPNPGDAGSSLGAAALAYGKQLAWQDAYLGHVIPGSYPVNAAATALMQDKIVGIASGAAEFGPRALGNRSLLADPRGLEIKDQVNEIKRRQKFRPFAPVILSEYVDQYFVMPSGWDLSPYMQSVGICRRPDLYPAIVHHDGTSRVQTVAPDSRSGIRQLLEAWYRKTGCPMLLNTSLNIRGEPMVNDRADADRFEKLYHTKVLS